MKNKLIRPLIGILLIFVALLIFAENYGIQKWLKKGHRLESREADNISTKQQTDVKTKSNDLEYELLKKYQYDDCAIWQNVYLKSGNIEDLTKELYKQRVSQNFRIFSTKDPIKIDEFSEWDVKNNSDKCLRKEECGEQLKNEILEWHDQNMIGFLWWTFDNVSSNNADTKFTGRWKLNKFINGQDAGSIDLENNNTVRPLNYKEVGTHTNSGKTWKDIVICNNYNGESLKYLAQRLHTTNPNDYFKLYDDDKMVQKYIEFDKNYPDIPLTKELEEWSDTYHIGIINKMPLEANDTPKWVLYLFHQVEGLPVDGIYLE